MAKRTYMSARNPRSAPLKTDLRDRRGGQGDDTKWLPKAARTALESMALDGLFRSVASLAARGLGRLAPVFVGPGKGMRPASADVADGVYVPRAAAERVGDLADLARFDAMLAGRDFASLPRAERVAIAKETGWQQLPTGETVRQLPKFEFAKGAWRGAERFATPARRRLSKLAGESVSELPDLELGEALAGPGAERFFGYYPEARRWLFRTDDLPPGTLGFVGTGSRMTRLSGEALAEGPETVANALHHEIQHVIQDASGLPVGSSSAEAYGELNRAVFDAVSSGRAAEPAVRRAARALVAADRSGNSAYYAYRQNAGEAGAYAAGNAAVEGPAPLLTDNMLRESIDPMNVYDLAAVREDAKGGEGSAPDPRGRFSVPSSPRPGGEAPSDRFSMSRNFLATDRVPETIFGIPVVSRKEDYTEADLRFFGEHPEAGGYYDLGEGSPEDGSAEGAPVQDDEPVPSAVPGPRFDEMQRQLMQRRAAEAKAKMVLQQKRAKAPQDIMNAFSKLHLATTEESRDAAFDQLGASYDLLAQEPMFAKNPEGGYVREDEVKLLYDLFHPRRSGIPSVDDYLELYYGDRAQHIALDAIARRVRATGRKGTGDIVSTPGSFAADDASRRIYATPAKGSNPLKDVVTTGVRDRSRIDQRIKDWRKRHGDRPVHFSSGLTFLPLTQLDSAFHEILGHAFNPIGSARGQPADPSTDLIPGSSTTWSGRDMYFVANDAELSAELGNLRKIMYRHMKGPEGNPVDIADPTSFESVYREFTADPSKFRSLPPTTRKMLRGLQLLRDYDGGSDGDQTKAAIMKRRDDVNRILANPDMIGQVVMSGQKTAARKEMA